MFYRRIVVVGGGTYDFFSLFRREVPQGLRDDLKEIIRPGARGAGFRLDGQKAMTYVLDAERHFATLDDAESQMAAFAKDAQGKVCSVHGMTGIVYTKQVCLNVEVYPATPIIAAVGAQVSNCQAMCRARIVMQSLI